MGMGDSQSRPWEQIYKKETIKKKEKGRGGGGERKREYIGWVEVCVYNYYFAGPRLPDGLIAGCYSANNFILFLIMTSTISLRPSLSLTPYTTAQCSVGWSDFEELKLDIRHVVPKCLRTPKSKICLRNVAY